MRGDQPVVWAASWMVRASTNPNLTTIVSRFGKQDPPCGRAILASGEGLAGGEEDRRARLVLALVGPHDGELDLGGVFQAREDLVEAHGVVAGPRLGDVNLRADAVRAARLGLARRLTHRRDLAARRLRPARRGSPLRRALARGRRRRGR